MRINKFIANNSDYSRRKVDELIIIGKVFINGEKAKQGDLVQPEKDRIEIDNRIIEYREEKTYLMLNKPAGYITTRNDEYNRRTVMDLIPQDKNLKPVGRLDKDTEGLLLFSNDGEFINRLTHPRYECEKEYFAVIYGELSQADQNKLEKGIIVEEKRTSPAKIWIEKIENGETEHETPRPYGRGFTASP